MPANTKLGASPLTFLHTILAAATLAHLCSGCVTTAGPESFRVGLDYAVEHGRSIDLLFFSTARDFSRTEKTGENGETIWTFVNNKTGCEVEYITDSAGRGIRYRYISPESSCYLESKFSGW